jgi:hypothetical protein
MLMFGRRMERTGRRHGAWSEVGSLASGQQLQPAVEYRLTGPTT